MVKKIKPLTKNKKAWVVEDYLPHEDILELDQTVANLKSLKIFFLFSCNNKRN